MKELLSGLHEEHHRVGAVDFHLYHGGEGPPLLLLHGYPQTAGAWWRVVRGLCEDYHVYIPDLPGYGGSTIADIDRFDFSKRNIGDHLLELMAHVAGDVGLHVAGHDRGARIAYRMGLDRPERILSLTVVDIVPTIDMAESLDYQSGLKTYHWFFLAQPFPLPEKLIGGNVNFYLRETMGRWAGDVAAIGEPAMAHYVDAFREPRVIHAACQDYRAGLTVDVEIDAADRRAGHKLAMPTLVINASQYLDDADRVRTIWSRWADDLRVVDVACGHFVMEERPSETLEALRAFLPVTP